MTVNVDPQALAARAAAELPADSFIARHIDAVREAVHEGADLRGYFAWSPLDNYEVAEGSATQRRTPKSSARWYSNLIAAHRARGAA